MKDYKKLEESINEAKEITIADITELGYSRYDINQFIEAGILGRIKRGIYKYLPELQVTNVPKVLEQQEETVEEIPVAEESAVAEQQVDGEQLFQYVNQGTYNLIKRQNEKAIDLFNKALELEPNHGRALIGLVGAHAFLNDYQKVYEYLVKFYNTRIDNSLLYNVYYYLFILKEHINIDEQLLLAVKEEIENNKDSVKKLNPNHKRLHKALEEDNYIAALKYVNFSISIDKKDKKYHITNQIYKALIMATLTLKGIDPYESIAKYREEKGLPFVRQSEQGKPMPEVAIVSNAGKVEEETSEEVVIIPQTDAEDTIKVNLLLEAINSNNYHLALTLLDQENIDNPFDIIRTLLTKLATIKSLVTSNEPVKVASIKPVRVIEEQSLFEEAPRTEKNTPVAEETMATDIHHSEESISVVDESTSVIAEPPEEPELTAEELIELAFKAFKSAYDSEQFDEASKNLRRYEFLNNSNGTQRNINYHRIRIEKSKKDFEQDPETYLKKKALAKVIFDLKIAKRYDAALSALEEYKSLCGFKHEHVLLVEAEIHFALEDISRASSILETIGDSEEPTFFFLSSRIAFQSRRYKEALSFCQAYNERKPNSSPANYHLMGDCYTKLGKSGKAVKAYRKAEDISIRQGGKKIDLSAKINKQEMVAEFKKEERSARNLGKKSKIFTKYTKRHYKTTTNLI